MTEGNKAAKQKEEELLKAKTSLEQAVSEFTKKIAQLEKTNALLASKNNALELSLIKKQNPLPEYFTDSLELLALSAIVECGKEPIDFDEPLMKFYGDAKDERRKGC